MQIRIGRLFQLLLGLASLSSCLSWGASVSVAWDPNSEPDLAGYRVYYTAGDHRMIDVGNQTNATLTDLQEGLTYTIYATAYNTAGLESAPSESITYTIPSAALPPSLATQPASQSLVAGQPVTFAVEATGAAPLSYQWFKDGVAINAATSATFSIVSAAVADAGAYSVRVSNAAGAITSDPAILTVLVPPTITAQPVSRTVQAGQSVAFTVDVTGTAPIAYQWFRTGSAIPGATSATFDISAVTAADAGEYSVRVSNAAGAVMSTFASLTVNVVSAPSISAQPLSQTVIQGQSALFSVQVTGTAPFSFQWYRNGSAIAGATSGTYSIGSVAESHAGIYQVEVSNAAGQVSSGPATLTVNVPPSITTQPVGQTVTQGQSAMFAVSATGTAPLSYQWFRNGTAISGATSADLRIAAAGAADAGTYQVLVSNPAGEVISSPALLSVNVPPVIEVQPAPQTVNAGASVIFSVQAAGTPAPSYQWFRNGTAISGATSADLRIAAASAADAGTYHVRVSNPAGEVESSPALLSVNVPPVIEVQPAPQTVNAGAPVIFSVQAAGTPAPSYQWFRNGAAISGATSADLRIAAASAADAGTYHVQVSNPAGEVSSSPALLSVNVPPAIQIQPEPKTVNAGASVSLSVRATATPAPSYQWYRNGSAVAGATSSTYFLAAVKAADAGDYSVLVKNAAGELMSATARLEVIVPPSIVSQPVSKTVNLGQSFSLEVQASGTDPLTYKWYRNGVVIEGATGATYAVGAAAVADAGAYHVNVSNAAGSIESNPATITVVTPPTITTQPLSQTVKTGQSVSFSVEAIGTGTLTYQWSKDGVWISGAVSSTYTIAAAETVDAGAYSVLVANGTATTSSQIATLSVVTSPRFSNNGRGQKTKAGEPVTLQVAALGDGPFEYQWIKDGEPLAEATSAILEIAPAEEGDAGEYSVEVSNTAGSVVAGPAVLDVVQSAANLSLALNGDTVQISGTATPGETYVVQSCADLGGGEWTTIQSVTLDSNGQFQLELPHDPAAPFRFFRTVIAEP